MPMFFTMNNIVQYLVSCTQFVKGLNQMPRGLRVSHPLIANMRIFFNSINRINENLFTL